MTIDSLMQDYNISLIVAMDKNNTIGQDNSMPWHLPNDLKFFKQNTQNKTIIMGRKTFQSIGSKALPNRRNIVISRNVNFACDGVELFSSITSAVLSCSKQEEIMIIGGGQLYAAMLSYANKLYITNVEVIIKGDTVFPKFIQKDWQEVFSQHHPIDPKHSFAFSFKIYNKTY